jgi:hypothetical protein
MLGAFADVARVAVHEFVRVLGVAELLLAGGGAQCRGRPVAPVLDLVRNALGTDVLQAVTEYVGALVDALADEFLARVPAVLQLAETAVERVASVGYQPASPRC